MQYPKFKVTVHCSTFNHAKFITDAMNGFTMQQTDFPFVCTIIDDASTDGEQDVIKQYVEEHFDLSEDGVAYKKETDYAHIVYAQNKTNKNCYFAVLFLKENHYSQKKDRISYLKEWRENVDYIALCEGDDYWIDPLKLQKQVEILDENRNIGLVYTHAIAFNNKTKKECKVGAPCHNSNELLLENTIPTLTVCLRQYLYRCYIDEIKPSSHNWLMGDYPMWLWFIFNSNIHFINDITAKYRILPESASHSSSFKKMTAFLRSTFQIREYFAQRYKSSLFPLFRFKILMWKYIEKLDKLSFRHRIIIVYKLFKKTSLKDCNLKTCCFLLLTIISKRFTKLILSKYVFS